MMFSRISAAAPIPARTDELTYVGAGCQTIVSQQMKHTCKGLGLDKVVTVVFRSMLLLKADDTENAAA